MHGTPHRGRDAPRRGRDRSRVRPRRRPTLAHHAQQRHAALHYRGDPLANRRLGLVAVGRQHDQSVRDRREPGECARGEVQEQQRVLDPEAAVQLLPARVGEQVTRVRRHRACGDEEDAIDFVRRLGERHIVFERVHDPLGGREAHRLVQRGLLEPQVHERNPSVGERRGAGYVPRGTRGPLEVPRGRHQRDQGLSGDQ